MKTPACYPVNHAQSLADLVTICTWSSVPQLGISVIFLLHPLLVIKYVCPVYTTRVTAIIDWSHCYSPNSLQISVYAMELSLSHPGIPGMTLCFCTCSYADTATTGCRHFFQYLSNNFSDFFHFWLDWWHWPIDYLNRFWLIFMVILTLNFQNGLIATKQKANILIEH